MPARGTDVPDFAVKADGAPDARFDDHLDAMLHLAELSLSGMRRVRITHREPRLLGGKVDYEIGSLERTDDGGAAWAGFDGQIARYTHRHVDAEVMSTHSSERLVTELTPAADACCAGGCQPREQKREIQLCAH